MPESEDRVTQILAQADALLAKVKGLGLPAAVLTL